MAEQAQSDPSVASAALPPSHLQTADEIYEDLRKMPLFMTSMEDLANAEDNPMIEALRQLAYEGTRAEVAENFKSQGNEYVAVKQWLDAREFYNKAIAALEGPREQPENPDGEGDIAIDGPRVVEIDEEAEAEKEKSLAEACHANRALCHLELKNYGSCIRDCAFVLRSNHRHVKAYFRAASACLALDRIDEAQDAASKGLEIDPENLALATLLRKIESRRDTLNQLEQARKQREDAANKKRMNLSQALKSRNIHNRESPNPPDMEDAELALEDAGDATSTLSLPLLILYPLTAQSDFIKSVSEHENIHSHLEYILPPPWDEKTAEYTNPDAVECYMETNTGGLIKAGKKLSFLKLLSSGKVELLDGIIRVNIVPKTKTQEYIDEFKRRRGPQS